KREMLRSLSLAAPVIESKTFALFDCKLTSTWFLCSYSRAGRCRCGWVKTLPQKELSVNIETWSQSGLRYFVISAQRILLQRDCHCLLQSKRRRLGLLLSRSRHTS